MMSPQSIQSMEEKLDAVQTLKRTKLLSASNSGALHHCAQYRMTASTTNKDAPHQ